MADSAPPTECPTSSEGPQVERPQHAADVLGEVVPAIVGRRLAVAVARQVEAEDARLRLRASAMGCQMAPR